MLRLKGPKTAAPVLRQTCSMFARPAASVTSSLEVATQMVTSITCGASLVARLKIALPAVATCFRKKVAPSNTVTTTV